MKGFTLIELLIGIGIIALIALGVRLNLLGGRSSADLTTATAEVATLLREAQSRSATQSQNVAWGVHFDNVATSTPFYALFYSAYTSATTIGRYPLPVDVQFSTSSVAAGSFLEVTFAQISGIPSASTSVNLLLTAGGRTSPMINSSTIFINSPGLISY